jgi:hypothetical protein
MVIFGSPGFENINVTEIAPATPVDTGGLRGLESLGFSGADEIG